MEKRLYCSQRTIQPLYCTVLDKNGSVEFSYPMETVDKNAGCRFDIKKCALTSQNKNAIYTVYSDNNGTGVDALVEEKAYHWIGDTATKKASTIMCI